MNVLLFSSLLNMIIASVVQWVCGRWVSGRWSVGRWSVDLIKPIIKLQLSEKILDYTNLQFSRKNDASSFLYEEMFQNFFPESCMRKLSHVFSDGFTS